MQNNNDLLNFLAWSFALGSLFDVIYLIIFLSRWRNTFIFLLLLIILCMLYYATAQRSDPWEKLGVLIFIMIALGIVGCGLQITSIVVASDSLHVSNIGSARSILIFIFHLCPLIIAILNFYLLIRVVSGGK
jgi:hypothetical protein